MSGITWSVAAYGFAIVAVSVLVWLGWVREVDADPGTLIACAATQMELANGIPGDDPEARALRQKMLDDAEGFVERAEAELPGHPVVLLARGDLLYLRGQGAEAITCYGEALEHDECTDDMVEQILLRRAELALEIGEPQLAVVDASRARQLDSARFGTAGARLEIRARAAAGDRDRALATAARLATSGGSEGAIAAGVALAEIGETEAAERAFRGNSVTPAVADYYVARLKLGVGEIDTARELLDRAVEGSPAEVRGLLAQDRARWAESLGEERVSDMLRPEAAAPR